MANVVFLWHMHQPYYVNPATRTAMMPWVRLHCVKGYLDMISILDEFPRVHVNFNLTPVLLLQIREIVDGDVTDLWLEWSRKPAAELTDDEKFGILQNFFHVNWDNCIKPHARYWELLNKRGLTFYADDVRRGLRYFTEQEIRDVQTWYNLAWCGYTAVRLYPELQALREKGGHFTEEEKTRVLDIHIEIMRGIMGRYAAAEARGQVELTTTPFFHPILPLVYDTQFATRSLPPERSLPRRFHWPQDAAAQLLLAVEQHEKFFGKKPRGLWPSEGSIAPELIPLMQHVGIEYFCSDEENLFNSLKRDPARANVAADHLELFQGWRVRNDGAAVNAVFREKPLSDFIGFMAAKNDPQAAAENLLGHMRNIAAAVPRDAGVIPLILDGENAWETFADGGEAFLRALYHGIDSDEGLHSCTIEDYFRNHPPEKEITTLHTGSWICSNFDIWIGEEEENRAWDLLGDTRQFLQAQIEDRKLQPAQQQKALMEIYAAEGSDWFWWYGPDFHTENADLFDALFRQHLKNVHTICGHVPPSELDRPIIRATTTALYESPRHLLSPEIDGRVGSYFEWLGAGSYSAGSEQGAMYRSERVLKKMFFGFDEKKFYLRLDLVMRDGLTLKIVFDNPAGWSATLKSVAQNDALSFSINGPDGRVVRCDTVAVGAIIEWAVALAELGLSPGAPLFFHLEILQNGIEVERCPESAPVQLKTPSEEFALQNWFV